MPQVQLSEAACAQADWQAQYEFWHKIISEEVERLRFNDGYEPFIVDLYSKGNTVMGKTHIGRKPFRATGTWTTDTQGKKVLRLYVSPEH